MTADVVADQAYALIAGWGTPIVIALLAVGARLFFSQNRFAVMDVFRGIFVGLFVGIEANLYLMDLTELSPGIRAALVGFAAVIAEDLLAVMIRIGKRIQEHPDAIIDRIINRKDKK